MNFNFIASNRLELEDFKSLEKFVVSYPDFQTVFLNNELELNLLLQIIGIKNITGQNLNEAEFSKYWDLSNFKLPELNEDEYDKFYAIWLEKSGRDNNMDEYGSLIFL